MNYKNFYPSIDGIYYFETINRTYWIEKIENGKCIEVLEGDKDEEKEIKSMSLVQ